ncbi:MAG: ATP-binding protein [Candidatus Latescibacteria bacterium]|nr:ATP-binding protein [Candidatus Latescibacterota bacterium]
MPRKTFDEPACLRFLHHVEDVSFLDPPSVGKSHLAIAFGLKTLEHGHRVYDVTFHDLVANSGLAQPRSSVSVFQNILRQPDLLLHDEVGYLHLEQHDATFLFAVVSERYKKGKSIILSSKESYDGWDEFFQDTILMSARLDRLLRRAITLAVRRDSYLHVCTYAYQRHRTTGGLSYT